MKKDFTNKEYKEYVERMSQDSSIVKDTVKAFLAGGFICAVGQAIANYMRMRMVDEETVKAALPIILIIIASFATSLGLFEKAAKFVGAGVTVPITGFANAVCAPAIEFRSEGIVMGIGAKMFVISGPVIVFGTISSVVVGALRYIGIC